MKKITLIFIVLIVTSCNLIYDGDKVHIKGTNLTGIVVQERFGSKNTSIYTVRYIQDNKFVQTDFFKEELELIK